jgi:3-phosphoshikimate 1-carboxyvinyltransferase
MLQELGRMKVCMELSEDRIRIEPGFCPPQEMLDGHNDHRIVMALSVLLTQTGGSIRGAQAVAKSLPDFFDRLKELGIKVKIIDETDQ